ncbi:dimethylamine monooxygenase subunit DmmA family protein [Ammoniphilus sp. YIM 78166]|uniref:dimethylamine monooxygenase subunit DmmA family protein n=1 Tax=Ammoniphilus sp. YIM 78166 TaxID=1644106 RepID=UPI00106F4FB1|nr:dimethylamine monooxygenase subunit DmmA family protein [Ammoniphilus sp. YIM 78166]
MKIPENAKKILVFLEDIQLVEQARALDELAMKTMETHIFIKSSISMSDVSNILKQQLIGTHLFICGTWPFIQEIKEKAYLAGFSEDELHYEVMGPRKEKAFCVKCYSYNPRQQEDKISCRNCQTSLLISNHYSRRLDAYLGYIHVS